MTNNARVSNNPVLTNLYRGYEPKEAQFLQDLIFPKIQVSNEKGDIRKLNTTADDFLRIHTNVRIGNAGTPEISFEMTKSTVWSTEEHALKFKVSKLDGKRWAEAGQAWQAGLDKAEQIYTRFLKKTFMMAREYALATALTTSGNFTNKVTLSGSDQFSDRVNSDPQGVFGTAKDSVFDAIGVEANTAIMSRATFEKLRIHPQLKKTAGGMGNGTVPVMKLSLEQLAMALDIDRILVGSAAYQAAKRGQTSSLTQVWGKSILVCYINPNPSPVEFEQSLGYKFVLDEPVMDSYLVEDPKDTKYIRITEEYDDVLLDEKAGYLIINAIA